jgi:peptidyl-prolyl cis-trans isomerase A (cyclophilin A)
VLLLGQGPDGHAFAAHEYVRGLDVLTACLKSMPDVQVLRARVDGPWKEGPELIGQADGVVLFLAEGAKWVSADPKRLQALRLLAKRGGGLTALHWATGTREAGPIEAFVDLFGGCHGGPDRKYKELKTSARVEKGHAIATGIEDITVKDEFYYQLKRPKSDRAVTPILKAKIDGEEHTVAWAYQRPGGGRAFGFTGLHFHDNWKLPAYRRLVAQGVLWSLGLPIPEGGLNVDVDAAVLPLEEKVNVVIRTEAGDIEVQLDRKRAPITVDNFLRYVDAGLYTGGRFHRTVHADNQPDDKVKIAVIQAGIDPSRAKEEFAPIKLERTKKTGVKHVAGAISMARDGPDTATGDFFLCVTAQPELDQGGKRNPDRQGFAAFGQVVKGMAVVRKINAAKASGQALTPPVRILGIARKGE